VSGAQSINYLPHERGSENIERLVPMAHLTGGIEIQALVFPPGGREDRHSPEEADTVKSRRKMKKQGRKKTREGGATFIRLGEAAAAVQDCESRCVKAP